MNSATVDKIGRAIGKAVDWGGGSFTLSLPLAIVLHAYLQRDSLELVRLIVSMSLLLGGALGFWTVMARPEAEGAPLQKPSPDSSGQPPDRSAK
jgi:hypothetical protein